MTMSARSISNNNLPLKVYTDIISNQKSKMLLFGTSISDIKLFWITGTEKLKAGFKNIVTLKYKSETDSRNM